MKFLSAIALTFMVSSAAAATTKDLPSCAQPCVAKAASAVGCKADDTKCTCSKQDEVQSKGTKCVLDACSSEDTMKAAQVAQEICQS